MDNHKITLKFRLVNPIFIFGDYNWCQTVTIQNKKYAVRYDFIKEKIINRRIYCKDNDPYILLDNKRIMLNQFECYHNGVIHLGSELKPE